MGMLAAFERFLDTVMRADWDPALHPRGKTTEESNTGSFAPGPGGSEKAQQISLDIRRRRIGKEYARLLGAADVLVGIQNRRLAIRAAEELLPVLQRLKQEGYPMPPSITFWDRERAGAALAGATFFRNNADVIRVEVMLPRDAPDDADLDDVARVALGNTTVRKFEDVLLHEIGHIYNGSGHESFLTMVTPVPRPVEQIRRTRELTAKIRAEVSEYATTHPDEFLAETFVKLYRGDVGLSAEVLAAYAKLGGKPPLRRAA